MSTLGAIVTQAPNSPHHSRLLLGAQALHVQGVGVGCHGLETLPVIRRWLWRGLGTDLICHFAATSGHGRCSAHWASQGMCPARYVRQGMSSARFVWQGMHPPRAEGCGRQEVLRGSHAEAPRGGPGARHLLQLHILRVASRWSNSHTVSSSETRPVEGSRAGACWQAWRAAPPPARRPLRHQQTAGFL